MFGLFINVLQGLRKLWQIKLFRYVFCFFGGSTALIIVFSCLMLALSGCASSQFSRGEFGDTKEVNLLNDKFTESTAEVLSKSVVEQLKTCPSLNPMKPLPFVYIEGINNQTEEMINLKMVSNQIKTSLIRSGKFRFIDKDGRQSLETEYQYNESGNVSGASRKNRGQQIGADLMLVGDLSSIVQEAGKDKTIYYQLDVQLTNVETGAIECVAVEKVRPVYKKHRE